MVHGRKDDISPSIALLQLRVSILEKLLSWFSEHCRCRTPFNSAHEPPCIAKDSGTSGGTERKSVMNIFERSEAHYGVPYKKYLGDGIKEVFHRYFI
ncbi:hypothetical protein TNCV_5035701 [Trichonephila clavipes]|nr:hypothetical protein TNCV_5035701 [Trichonephila clavipes]